MNFLMDHNYFVIFMSLLTVYVLFGDDIRVISSDKSADQNFDIVMLCCFSIFVLEIIASFMFKVREKKKKILAFFLKFFFLHWNTNFFCNILL